MHTTSNCFINLSNGMRRKMAACMELKLEALQRVDEGETMQWAVKNIVLARLLLVIERENELDL